MDERVLLKKLKNKSEKALEETIQKYTAYVTTIIKEIVNTRATAEDIEELVADTFIALWSTSERIDDVQYSNLKAYIGMIARNKANVLRILFFREAGLYLLTRKLELFFNQILLNWWYICIIHINRKINYKHKIN